MAYEPLPDGLTIQKSSIEGLGVFTNKFIEKDTDSYYVKKPNDPTVYIVDSGSAKLLQMPKNVALLEN